jgi:hypothetical protein
VKKDLVSIQNLIKEKANLIVLVLMLFIFVSYSLTIALNLRPGIIPDEEAHFAFAKYFATTWGIPPDTYETYQWGWYIEQNPFIYHWINGRLINLIQLIKPSVEDFALLIILRLINALFALGMVLLCYLTSKEIIEHKWWQLLPVFFLTNTLMFVFLSGGLNYGNFANLLSMAGLYFIVRAFKGKAFVNNSLTWMTLIALGTLVKFTILPLALAMGLAWIVYLVIHRKSLFPLKIGGRKPLILALILFLLLIGNILIYGINLIRYQSVIPACKDILEDSQCQISPYATRHQEMALDEKLTVLDSIIKGYPNPIEYSTNTWIWNLFLRTYGILGHQSYFPIKIIDYYQILFYVSTIIGFLFWKKSPFSVYSLIGICLFYALVLLYQNYQIELSYGFQHISLQGRYIFPVIGLGYILLTLFIQRIPNHVFRGILLILTMALFIYGGPLTFILKYDTFFSDWFF